MTEGLEAVREVRRAAQELNAACTGAALAELYAEVLAEPVPDTMLALLARLNVGAGGRSRRRWRFRPAS